MNQDVKFLQIALQNNFIESIIVKSTNELLKKVDNGLLARLEKPIFENKENAFIFKMRDAKMHYEISHDELKDITVSPFNINLIIANLANEIIVEFHFGGRRG
ncbi:MAG: hypothetical protein ACFFG0_02200 [Candidatus Thorarchaeota archaeon]